MMERENTAGEKQAIIILPGIMGSEIFAEDNITVGDVHFEAGTRLWAPEAKDGFHIDEKILALAMTDKGEPVYPTYAAPPLGKPDAAGHYGTGDAYRNLYHGVSSRFRTFDCDVVLYTYDWRCAISDTARALDDFIRERRYRDVVFIVHSMGGLVSSAYLAMGEEQRGRVRLHISLGTPYLGAEKMVFVYGSGKILDGSFFSELANLIIDPPIREIIANIPAVYALFPPKYRFRPYLFDETGALYSDYVSTAAALKNCFPAFNTAMMEEAEKTLSGMFAANHPITAAIPSYYIVGSGVKTPRTVSLAAKGDDCCRAAVSGEDPAGDGTVGLYSATAAGTVDRSRIFCLCRGAETDPVVASHTGMVACRDGGVPLPLLIDLIRGIVTEKTADAVLTARYGVCRP